MCIKCTVMGQIYLLNCIYFAILEQTQLIFSAMEHVVFYFYESIPYMI